ncbi:hypothetical protein B0H14DRAFT_2619118 [Mycena olivaceomarginata]|nr:hypothetical protein B0H14DRAFT_2619118 [Mycena olivaceomarginata]
MFICQDNFAEQHKHHFDCSGPTLAELWRGLREVGPGASADSRADLAKARLMGSRLGSRNRKNAVLLLESKPDSGPHNYETSMGLPSNLFRRQLQLTVSFVDSKQLRGLLEFDSGLGLVLWYVLEENARQMKKAELPKNSQCKTKDKYQEDVLSTASLQFHGEWIMLAQVVPSGDAVLPHQ